MSKLPLEATQRLMVYYSRISLGELKYDKWGAMCWAGVISGYTGGLEDFSDDDAAAAVHLIPDLMKRALSAANAAKLGSNIGAIRNAASKHMVFNLLGVPPDHPGRGTGTGNIMWEATGAEKKGGKWVSLQQHKAISAVAEKWLELISEEVLKQKQTMGDLPLVQTCLKRYAGNADLDSVYANFVFLKSPSPVELAALCAVPALSPQLRKFVPTTETLAASVFTSTQGYCKKADGAGHVRVKYEEGEP
uniref:Uncharacterized protein n=1 Tax=Chromera velia CCMP2878 TaxID=1169474 RepID=A0A0G4IDM1_9ALVE|eukprot:Cvel_13341.t1-p1 / transcript=Cvel_13341.t1 / gene=Cvel_13341 / organism=Chromera_velia_CCMP2878 / gene_product=hypothetical protein / transcript_product=hypothetical protein / location=Cvel_scaffold906:17693-19239(-) / protein_length=247 / sequence_SO=supercontig / SO=protein_coding / is_pseudo=false